MRRSSRKREFKSFDFGADVLIVSSMKKLAVVATFAALLGACTTVGSDGALPEGAAPETTTTTPVVTTTPSSTTTPAPATTTTTTTTIPIVTNTPQPRASVTTTPDPVLINPAAAQPVAMVTANGSPGPVTINIASGQTSAMVSLQGTVDNNKDYDWTWWINGAVQPSTPSGNPANWSATLTIGLNQSQMLYTISVNAGNNGWGDDSVQVLLTRNSPTP